MYLRSRQINICPSRAAIDKTMAEDFKKSYSSTRVLIDSTEVRCQIPSSQQLNGELFSNYKQHTTLKSNWNQSRRCHNLYKATLHRKHFRSGDIWRSDFLDLPFADNDSVMADDGFTIQDLLPLGVSLNIPPFLMFSRTL